MRALRAVPAMMRIGVLESFAYRAELFIWVLATTMPLIMLPLWHAVAEHGPIHGYGPSGLTAYFLGAFVVRQMTGAWAAWTINYEVRTGALSQRLLRPISPIWPYACESIASIPIRGLIAVPVGLAALVMTGGAHVAHGFALWAMVPLAFAGAWALTFVAHVIIGALSLWMHQSIKLMDLWNAGFFVFSGYLVPIAVFPAWLQPIPRFLPFESQLGFPVELLTGRLDPADALARLGTQWLWVLALSIVAAIVWTRGLRRYGAYGG